MGWYGACTSSGSMWVWMVLGLIILIAVGTWAVVRLTGSEKPEAAARETPRQALDRRLAAGEISVEQYLHTKQVLEDDLRAGTGT